jgi:hypothetical protein
VKTAELDGVLLDYWTARADGLTAKIVRAGERLNGVRADGDVAAALTPGYADWWQPFHVYWGSAGPIIEREKITLVAWTGGVWQAFVGEMSVYIDESEPGYLEDEPTPTPPLVAAMRAFVASRFGDTVPDEPRAG